MALQDVQSEPQTLGIRAACRRVNRSRRTLYLWMAQGMPSRKVGGGRFVELDDLLTWYRRAMVNERRGQFQPGNTAASRVN
ncbi:hypothetical protein GCM10010988_05860 [Cnuibacter physcomitrellae]|uniref:helix-turn-helix domain-containing protein n=1 Tax=Cnuibacter physcomitrellae TaxID=1619308 RepID=UPI0012F4B738|nr:helix-turn-helix domain-containing protein [Cnuibacter physcomitrellae]GGI35819.1 hypothetical protein GCM10010988_05860 [Cnuibacter physcomitrellae]